MVERKKVLHGCPPGGGTITPAHGGRIGQTPYEPTPEDREKVLELVAVGCAHQQIIQLIKHPDGRPISIDTLRRHFREELDNGALVAATNVAGVLYRGAMCGNPALIRIYANTHFHRVGLPTEKQTVELSGVDGEPIKNEMTIRFVKAGEVDPAAE